MTEQQPKIWWRPLAESIVKASRAGTPITLPSIADLIESSDLDFGVAPAAFAAAVRGAAGRSGGVASKLPSRDKGTFARAVWRQLMFALGHNLSIGGLIVSSFEADAVQLDVAEDFATILGVLLNGRSIGADEWRTALGLQS
jgi:hypothetical protein